MLYVSKMKDKSKFWVKDQIDVRFCDVLTQVYISGECSQYCTAEKWAWRDTNDRQ